MSIYTNYLKSETGYYDLEPTSVVSNHTYHEMSVPIVQGDPTVSIATNHKNLGQVSALIAGNQNSISDSFTSKELHQKSAEALNNLKTLFSSK